MNEVTDKETGREIVGGVRVWQGEWGRYSFYLQSQCLRAATLTSSLT